LGRSPICAENSGDFCGFVQGAGMNMTLDLLTTPVSTNDLDYPTGQRGGKAFATLAARFALLGYQLARTDANDGPVSYYSARFGQFTCLPALCDVQRLLAQLEAAP
jgi:hypothetical protein